jgi:hydrogenase maturation protein HypF
LGFTRESTFEGQAAIWLEHQARHCPLQTPYPFPDLDPHPLIQAIVTDRLAGRDIAQISAAFHAALVSGIVEQIQQLTEQHRCATAVLSGGVFQNELLLTAIMHQMQQIPRLHLLTNQNVPVNDGGISLGQAALAAVRSQ